MSINFSGKLNQRRIYGRRQGRPLGPSRRAAMVELMPALAVPEALLKQHGTLDPSLLFPSLRAQRSNPEKLDRRVGFQPPRDDGIIQKPLWMEIGFGSGEHLTALLRRYPNVNFIGAEPYIDGMAAFLKTLHEKPCDNIRVFMDDALLLVHALRDQCLDRLYILNPDPWPKKRHHKRRIINRENLDEFARIMKPGAELIMATDVDDLAEWMATQCMNHPAFGWTAERAKDWQTPPPEWLETRYAFKGRTAGRHQTFLIFKRNHLSKLSKKPI